MRLGIVLPTWHGNLVDATTVLEWATVAEDTGFHAVGVHDKPLHDTWDPIATLAGVAVATHSIRLATTAVQLPPRDEALLAKQAAVVDQLSGGRLDLGVAIGARADDYELLGRTMAGRGARFEAQLARLVGLWTEARATRDSGLGAGPVPVQDPYPPLWVGGYADAAVGRAIRFGVGYLFGAPGVEAMAARVPEIRAAAAAAGRPGFQIGGLAYVVPSDEPHERAAAERLLLRYYGTLRKPFAELVLVGTGAALLDGIRRYEAAGLDILHLLPVSTSVTAVERLAADVLPAYALAAR